MKSILTCLVLLLLIPGSVLAQIMPVPPLMNFQGRLARTDGSPVSDGNYAIRFSFWTAQTGGSERWNQTINPVSVRNGVVTALLAGFPNETFYEDIWLEIKIGNSPALTPRQRFASVAYAMKADSIRDGGVTTNSLAAGSVTLDKLANIGFVPSGNIILGNSPTPPPGYTFTGDTLASGNPWAMRKSISRRSSSSTGRYDAMSATVNGKLYVIGGYGQTSGGVQVTSTNYEYDPVTGTWTSRASMPTARALGVAVAADGKIHVLGGITVGNIAVHEIYDPATDQWNTGLPMPVAMRGMRAVEDNHKIYVGGGYPNPGSFYEYDLASNTWTSKAPLPTPRSFGVAMAVVDHKIYVIGGYDSNDYVVNACEVYDIATNTWAFRAPLPVAAANLVGATVAGKIYVLAGEDDSDSDALGINEEYDPARDTWKTRTPMPIQLKGVCVSVIGGNIHLIGGKASSSSIPKSFHQVYTPEKTYYLHTRN